MSILLEKIVDISPTSASNRFRAKRFALFMGLVNRVLAENGTCKIIDLGGRKEFWASYGRDLPGSVHVTLVNLELPSDHDVSAMRYIQGDACDLREFPDNAFDIVFSNSLIEHVGLWPKMAAMAAEARRLAPRYFVQTPNFWFPFEPHAQLPFFQFLPEPWRISLLMKRNCGFYRKAANIGVASTLEKTAILLDARQMTFLFPEAKILRERFLGLTKSLIAVKE